jgi:beta-galactosidase/beta-glucuronidase
MRRFYRLPTEQGYARVTGGNRLLDATQNEWQSQLDPQKVGFDLGYHRPDLTGPNWQTLKTASHSFSSQGLRYYKGLVWYRQTVTVPADVAGQRVFLWCGGVDELAKVWLNGQPVGISHGAAFYPFELDATAAVKPGANTIVIAVSNERVNELGTGGLVAPVLLYVPKDGADAKLENTRDLKPTFP